MATTKVDDWSTDDVSNWLTEHGFKKYCRLLCEDHQIDGAALLALTENDLRQPPIEIKVLGDIKRIGLCLKQLQEENYQSLKRNAWNTSASGEDTLRDNFNSSLTVTSPGASRYQDFSTSGTPSGQQRRRRRIDSFDSEVSDQSGLEFASRQAPAILEPEIWKTACAVLYFFAVTWITAIVMVVVHDRVPDVEKYPPLPDIFLDNVPLIPWAFNMCEITACILLMVWTMILICHKHRFILLRRMFALLGSVFLLRCVTMLITSLSVPGRHLDCKARPYGDFWAKVSQAFSIWIGAGMSIQGVRTCGDYMFSGHTVMLTMLNFFITEYTPRSLYYLHTFTWVLNMFGIFFILAAHEHYSIDVFIAFYISTRLFLYYHTLANNRDLMQRDSKRTRIWFPLFSFFEARVGGIVPNELQWPFHLDRLKLFLVNLPLATGIQTKRH